MYTKDKKKEGKAIYNNGIDKIVQKGSHDKLLRLLNETQFLEMDNDNNSILIINT